MGQKDITTKDYVKEKVDMCQALKEMIDEGRRPEYRKEHRMRVFRWRKGC